MSEHVSAARVSELIGLLYDCAIDPGRWEPALEAIQQELRFKTAVLAAQELPSGAMLLAVQHGMPPEFWPSPPKYDSAVVEVWGGYERLMAYPLDEPVVNSHVVDDQVRAGNAYYQDFAIPYGLIDVVAIAFARDPRMIGSLAFGRHSSHGPIGDPELAALRLIAPHVRRAVSISKLLDMKSVVAATFSGALDTFSSGIVLVDEQLGIVHANTAAQAMMEVGDPIKQMGHRLAFRHPVATQALAGAVAQCILAEHELGRRGLGVPLKRENGDACVAHVLPLRVGHIRTGLNARAAAAIFIAAATAAPQLPGDALALLYDLTPAESRVFESVASGEAPADIANRLGIATATVKTHLLRVFQKTGCNRQADLVKLAGSLAMPY
jgi:DNA-binding CsgD family transcriptional regulator